jgi:hypothetical protein
MAPPLDEKETVTTLLSIYGTCLDLESSRLGEDVKPTYTASTAPTSYAALCDVLEGDIAQLDGGEDMSRSWLILLSLLATALRLGENVTR